MAGNVSVSNEKCRSRERGNASSNQVNHCVIFRGFFAHEITLLSVAQRWLPRSKAASNLPNKQFFKSL